MKLINNTLKKLSNLKIRWLVSKYSIGGKYRRIYHYHIRKTAGSSLNSAFWGLAGLDLQKMGDQIQVCKKGLVFVRFNRELIEKGQYFFANSHRPIHSLTLPNDTFTITILRNPLERLLSHYRYILWARDNDSEHTKEPMINAVRQEIPWIGDSFLDFLHLMPKEHFLCQLFMFSKDYDINEATERILSCSAVLLTKTFNHDLNRLGKKLRIPLRERHERRFVKAFQISSGEKKMACDMLETEFKMIEKVVGALGR